MSPECSDKREASGRPIVGIDNVYKDYPLGQTVVHALSGVSLTVNTGDFATIAGPSGSGKTTLLNLVGCVDIPTKGSVSVDGQETTRLSERQLTRLRLHKLGFVFQSFNLISVLSAFHNVEFPLLLQGEKNRRKRRQRVLHLLEKVGLADHIKHRPNELSGGQRQRVAIARALVTNPCIVLADEPTANLDSKTGESIVDLMKEINDAEGTTFIFSTHDKKVMQHADRIIQLVDGQVAGDEK